MGLETIYHVHVINPRHACAERVTVVVSCVCVSVCLSVYLSVCLYVCLSEHAILAVRAIRSITNDAIVLSIIFAAILKRRFSYNCLIQKLQRFSLTSARGPSLVDAYSACNVSYTLRYMFAYA